MSHVVYSGNFSLNKMLCSDRKQVNKKVLLSVQVCGVQSEEDEKEIVRN